MAVRLLTHVTSTPCVTELEKGLRLAWRIRVMRLIRGTPVHRINPGARINHANHSDSPGPSAGDAHARRDANSRHVGISGTRLFGETRDHLAAFHDREDCYRRE